ncbi:MAG: tryptophan synthase subunit alpha [Cyclobacteriaceae bacterium]|jgi:tryptophan synthase alpha chain
MKNRLTTLFQTKTKDILSVFFTAGFPTTNDTPVIAHALEKAGADLIEIGIPFSDPIADGPVIQQSSKAALEQGMTLPLLLQQVKEMRSTVKIPIVLMGYLNPVLQYGIERFCREASAAGVDGVIIPDLPLRDFRQHENLFHEYDLSVIMLVTPTTPDNRIRLLDQLSSGFLYAVSASSTTGVRAALSAQQEEYFKRLSKLGLRNPVLAGFGISDAAAFQTVCRHCAGAIVGSAFIGLLKESKNLEGDISTFVSNLRLPR